MKYMKNTPNTVALTNKLQSSLEFQTSSLPGINPLKILQPVYSAS